jgi:hypothetical protein
MLGHRESLVDCIGLQFSCISSRTETSAGCREGSTRIDMYFFKKIQLQLLFSIIIIIIIII